MPEQLPFLRLVDTDSTLYVLEASGWNDLSPHAEPSKDELLGVFSSFQAAYSYAVWEAQRVGRPIENWEHHRDMFEEGDHYWDGWVYRTLSNGERDLAELYQITQWKINCGRPWRYVPKEEAGADADV